MPPQGGHSRESRQRGSLTISSPQLRVSRMTNVKRLLVAGQPLNPVVALSRMVRSPYTFRAPSCVPMVASVTLRDAERIRGGYNAGITLIQDTVVSAVRKAVSAAISASASRFFSRSFIVFSSFLDYRSLTLKIEAKILRKN